MWKKVIDIVGFDLNYDESKDLCSEAWKNEDNHYLYNDGSQNKSEAK